MRNTASRCFARSRPIAGTATPVPDGDLDPRPIWVTSNIQRPIEWSTLTMQHTFGTCADVVAFCGRSVLEKKATMACSKEKPLDNPTFEACQEALVAALATVQQWRPGGEVDPHLKAKLALLIIKHAAKGETSPAILRKRALANYFLESACEESGPSGHGISES